MRVKKNPAEWEKILANYSLDKGLIYIIYVYYTNNHMWFIFTMEYNSVTKRMKSHLQQHGWRKRMLQ
jgi:hypothetical protein